MTFNGKKIKGILLDITGVLTESVSGGGSRPVAGSVEAVNRIKAAGNQFLNQPLFTICSE